LSRGGFPQEAQAIKASYYANPSIPAGGSVPVSASKTAGMNMFVTIALVGAAIFAITKMKR
jgi:hypothetical protein